MTLNDLEPSQKGFLVNFSQYLDAAHISVLNSDEMAGDRPRQGRLAHVVVNEKYPCKKWLFILCWLVWRVNGCLSRHSHAAYHNKH